MNFWPTLYLQHADYAYTAIAIFNVLLWFVLASSKLLIFMQLFVCFYVSSLQLTKYVDT